MPLVLLNPLIGPYQVLPRWAIVDLGPMAMKGCTAFPKAPASLEPHYQISVISRTLIGGVLPLSRGAVDVFTAPADWASVYICVRVHAQVVKLFNVGFNISINYFFFLWNNDSSLVSTLDHSQQKSYCEKKVFFYINTFRYHWFRRKSLFQKVFECIYLWVTR